ncbi:Eukaryotic translation initiation factor 6 [Histomonas meleagridis]|uniref:Eukaryotic translation initiation factor 6 n=1 Tax=Histomonas meleagridis TaxID=135588 RepID=UPI00355A0956|nr:Eukaryotic translation initiation factor 6 [Histomonas meleagridis]KAH0805283.1 Eukaryotic translation initiation factor 6 [Histomonas meleagridis]
MVSRCRFQSSSEVGAYARITNSYAILPSTNTDNFFQSFESILSDKIPIIHSSIAGTPIVGRLVVGNKNGLIVPLTTTTIEIDSIRANLPESIEIAKIEERFSALGNVISCNDHFALVHPELDEDTLETLERVLGVEVIKTKIAEESLVGSYSVMTNKGCIVTPKATPEEIESLSKMLDITVEAATVNRGIQYISAGVCVNDFALFCGYDCTALEIANLTRIFKIDDSYHENTDLVNIDDSFVSLL